LFPVLVLGILLFDFMENILEVDELEERVKEHQEGGDCEVAEVEVEEQKAEPLEHEDEVKEAEGLPRIRGTHDGRRFHCPAEENVLGNDVGHHDVYCGKDKEVGADDLEEKCVGQNKVDFNETSG
jgi:hypothetical protein